MGLLAVLREEDVRLVEDEPRIQDIRLAEALEFAHPLHIRKLIERNSEELSRHGVLSTTDKTSGPQGGRPGTEYWLNEAQAILICMRSDAPRAADVRAEIIDVFRRWRHGEIVPVSHAPVTLEAIGTLFDTKLEPMRVEIKQIQGNVLFLARRVDDIVPRREFPKETKQRWRYVVFRRYSLECTCCRHEKIIDAEQNALPNLNYDHFRGRELNGPYDGWPVCTRCNLKLRDNEFKNAATKHFDVFHDYQRQLFAAGPRLKDNGQNQGDFFDRG